MRAASSFLPAPARNLPRKPAPRPAAGLAPDPDPLITSRGWRFAAGAIGSGVVFRLFRFDQRRSVGFSFIRNSLVVVFRCSCRGGRAMHARVITRATACDGWAEQRNTPAKSLTTRPILVPSSVPSIEHQEQRPSPLRRLCTVCSFRAVMLSPHHPRSNKEWGGYAASAVQAGARWVSHWRGRRELGDFRLGSAVVLATSGPLPARIGVASRSPRSAQKWRICVGPMGYLARAVLARRNQGADVARFFASSRQIANLTTRRRSDADLASACGAGADRRRGGCPLRVRAPVSHPRRASATGGFEIFRSEPMARTAESLTLGLGGQSFRPQMGSGVRTFCAHEGSAPAGDHNLDEKWGRGVGGSHLPLGARKSGTLWAGGSGVN